MDTEVDLGPAKCASPAKKCPVGRIVACGALIGTLVVLFRLAGRLLTPAGGAWEPHQPSSPYLPDPLIDEELDEVSA